MVWQGLRCSGEIIPTGECIIYLLKGLTGDTKIMYDMGAGAQGGYSGIYDTDTYKF